MGNNKQIFIEDYNFNNCDKQQILETIREDKLFALVKPGHPQQLLYP